MFNGGVLKIYLFIFFTLLLSAVKVKVTSIFFFDRHIDRKDSYQSLSYDRKHTINNR